jgi:hypothetical protein
VAGTGSQPAAGRRPAQSATSKSNDSSLTFEFHVEKYLKEYYGIILNGILLINKIYKRQKPA